MTSTHIKLFALLCLIISPIKPIYSQAQIEPGTINFLDSSSQLKLIFTSFIHTFDYVEYYLDEYDARNYQPEEDFINYVEEESLLPLENLLVLDSLRILEFKQMLETKRNLIDQQTVAFNNNSNHKVHTLWWQWISTIVILFVVILLVCSGIYISYKQFMKEFHLPSAEIAITEIRVSKENFEIKTSIIGVIILFISFLFFYLYLIYVYPISYVS